MSDEDSPLEEDETEFLVYVEFDGTGRSDVFSNDKLQLDMIGLDMEHPVMRINGRYFEGTYEDAVGTYMFFDKEKNPVVEDPVFDIPPKLKYFTKTRKILKMKRIFVKPRLDVMEDSNRSQSVPNLDTLKEAGVPPYYQEEALNLWKEMRVERLEALNEYLEKQKIREEKRQKGIEPDSESDEESPFAMYKTKTNEAEKSLDPEDKSAVIDSGPSTSKANVSPSNSGSTKDAQLPKSSSQIKNQGYLQVYSERQRAKKKLKKRTKKTTPGENCTDKETVVSESGPIGDNGESQDNSGAIPGEQLQGEDRGSLEKSDSDAMSQTSEANSQDDDVEYVSDKKLDKKMKRQAKIKEISERLKRTADEIKSKTNL